MLRKLFVVMAVLALVAAACGDSSETTTTTTTMSPDPTTTKTPPPSTDAVVWAGIAFDPARYQPTAGAVPNRNTIEIKRELYGQLLERTEPAPSPPKGPVIFRALSQTPGSPVAGTQAIAGCTYLRDSLLVDASFDRDHLEAMGVDLTELQETVVLTDSNGNPIVIEITLGLGIDPLAIVERLDPTDPTSRASLHYVLLPATRWKWAPDSDPVEIEPPPALEPAATFTRADVDQQVPVLVFDAFRDQRRRLEGVQDPATGHGEFIVNVVNQLTPGLDDVRPIEAGSDQDNETHFITEVSLQHAVAETVLSTGPAVVNMSFGHYACECRDETDVDPSDPTEPELEGDYLCPASTPIGPILLPHTLQAVQAQGAVVVAAAGNDGLTGGPPFLPAGYAVDDDLGGNIVSVGAFDLSLIPPPVDVAAPAADFVQSHGTAIATFSNRASWVEVYAPGVNIPGELIHDKPITYDYTYETTNTGEILTDSEIEQAMQDTKIGAGPDAFTSVESDDIASGWVQWDGTSFAAPHVAAAIAGRAAKSNGDVLAACNQLFGDACG